MARSALQAYPYSLEYKPSSGITIQVATNGYAELNGQTFAYQSPWSDPETWPGGILPAEGDDVTIPEGELVLLDVHPPKLGTIFVLGQLRISDTQVGSCSL